MVKYCLTEISRTRKDKSMSSQTFKLGVDGSGSLMLRGKALRMTLRIWMQLKGITSQKLK